MGTPQQQQSNMSRMDEVIAAFKAVFDAVDTDGSGALDKAEILKVAKGIAGAMGQAEEMANMPPEMADEMFKQMLAEEMADRWHRRYFPGGVRPGQGHDGEDCRVPQERGVR